MENGIPVNEKLKDIMGNPKYDMGCCCDNCVYSGMSDWTLLKDNPCHSCNDLSNYLYIHKIANY